VLANYLIGLREGLEAALVVSILIAYLVRTDRRRLLPGIWAGVAVAVAVSLAFGALLTYGPRGLTFEAQELIGGSLSIIAVCFVTWMIFWMARAARTLSGELRGQIDKAADGSRWSLAVVAVLAVGREGLETALFLWAATQAGIREAAGTSTPTWQPLLGAALGLATAVLIAYLLYRGAITINLARFFTWTGGFLILVAAGVLSYGVHDLQEADVLPGLNRIAFDVSDTIDPSTWYATLLKGIFNFSPVTTWLEAAAWLLYAVPVMALFLLGVRRRGTRPAPVRPASSPSSTTPTSH
jgi:high-affinity iron transporter